MDSITNSPVFERPPNSTGLKQTDSSDTHLSFEHVLGKHLPAHARSLSSISRRDGSKPFLLAQTPPDNESLKAGIDNILNTMVSDDPAEMTTGQFIANFVDLALEMYIEQGGDPQQIEPDTFGPVIESLLSIIETHEGFADINIGRRHGEEVREQTIKRLRKSVDAVRYADYYQSLLNQTTESLFQEVPQWEARVRNGENLMVVIDLDDTAVIGNSFYFLHHLDPGRVNAVGQVAAAREALQNFAEHGVTGTQVIPATKQLVDDIEAAAKRLDAVPGSGVLAYTFMAGRPPEYRAKTEQVLKDLGLLGDYAYEIYYGDPIGEGYEGLGTAARKSAARTDLQNRGFTIVKVIDNAASNLTGNPAIDTLMPNIGDPAPLFTPQGLRNLEVLTFDAESIQHHQTLYGQDVYGLAVVMGRPFEGKGQQQLEVWNRQLSAISNGKIQMNLQNLHARLGTLISSSDTPLTEADKQSVGLDNIKEALGDIKPFEIHFKRMFFGDERENGNIILEGEVNANAGLNEAKRLMLENGAVSIRMADSRPGEPAKVYIVLKQFSPEEINSLSDTEAENLRNWVESHGDLSEQVSISVGVDQFKIVHYSQQQLLAVAEAPEEIALSETSQLTLRQRTEPEFVQGVKLTDELRGADLQGIQMPPGQDWSNADLIQTNLSNSTLTQINLSHANLSWADLSGADLNSASLNDANLFQAKASGINLTAANMQRADIRGANLSGANLQGADLQEANLHSTDLSESQLMQASLNHTDLGRSDLQGADLRQAHLYLTNLKGANLVDADLSGAMLRDVDLQGARLGNANLSGAFLMNVRLNNADMDGVNLQGAVLHGLDLGGNARPLLGALNAEPMQHLTSLYKVLSASEFQGLRDALQSPNALAYDIGNLQVFIEQLNNPDLRGRILKALPADTVSTSRFLTAARRLGVDTEALLWDGLEQYALKKGEDGHQFVQQMKQTAGELSAGQREYYVRVAIPLFAKLYSDQNTVRDVFNNLSGLLQGIQKTQRTIAQQDQLAGESFSAHSRFRNAAVLHNRENFNDMGTFESLGTSLDNKTEHNGMATSIALEARLLNQFMLEEAGIDPATYGAQVIDAQELGQYAGMQIYNIKVNHLPGNTLREELDSGASFSAEDVQRIREYLQQANGSLVNAGLKNNVTEFHTGNILISRDANQRISEVHLIGLDLEKINPQEAGYHHIETLLHLEEISLHYLRSREWAALPAALPENLTDNILALSESVQIYAKFREDISPIKNGLNRVSRLLASIPQQRNDLRAPYQAIVNLLLQIGQLEVSELNLSPQTIQNLGLPAAGGNGLQAYGSTVLGFDIRAPKAPQDGQSPQASLYPGGDISSGGFSTTPFNRLDPHFNPNGLVGNDGTQAGHNGGKDGNNISTAVAADENPFSNSIPDNVPLELQSGLDHISIPEQVPGWMRLPVDPERSTALADETGTSVADTRAETQATSQQEGGVTWGGKLGSPSDAERSRQEMDNLFGKGWSQGLRQDEFPKIDPNDLRVPGFGEGLPQPDIDSYNTSWGLPDIKIKPTEERFPEQDRELENILRPNGEAGPTFIFPPGTENDRLPKEPEGLRAAVIKALPELQKINYMQFSQLSAADQQQILKRTLEYRQLSPANQARISLIDYLDSTKTSEPQRRQLSQLNAEQNVQQAKLKAIIVRTGLSENTVEWINSRINALQANITQLNQHSQAIQNSNAQRLAMLTAQAKIDPIGVAFIKPEPTSQSPATDRTEAVNTAIRQNTAIPRFMVIRTANGPQLMENLPNGQTQMHFLPLAADTPITRQLSDGRWSGVPDVGQIGGKLFLDLLFTQGALKMLNKGGAIKAPDSNINQLQQPVHKAPDVIPQPGF